MISREVARSKRGGIMSQIATMMLTLGGILGTINDLLNPLFATAYLVVILCSIVILVSLLIVAVDPVKRAVAKVPAPTSIQEFFQEYWAAPFIFGVFLLGLTVLIAAYFTQQTSDSGGVVAGAFPAVAEWKAEMGITNSHLAKIEEDASRIAAASESINKKATNFKKEVSSNPRKELSNLGVSWTNDAFGQALLNNDIYIVNLFVAGGWNLGSEFEEGNAIGHYVFRANMDDPNKIRQVIDIFISNGVKINNKVFRFRGLRPGDIATYAAQACNLTLLKIAIHKGARINSAQSELNNGVITGRFSPECDKNRPEIEKILSIKLLTH